MGTKYQGDSRHKSRKTNDLSKRQLFLLVIACACLTFLLLANSVTSAWRRIKTAQLLSLGNQSFNYLLTTVKRSQNISQSVILKLAYNCSKQRKSIAADDILCMEKPKFLPNYKNPCWYNSTGGKKELRCLPYFHIIGVCKTGTSDLFKRLVQHPQIIQNHGIINKETWYWTWKRYGHVGFHRRKSKMLWTLDMFIKQFDANTIGTFTINKTGQPSNFHPIITGHGDPMDFWDHASWKQIPQNDPNAEEPFITTPSLIKHINPEIKLILMLRNPTDRVYSSYIHSHFGISARQFHLHVVESLRMIDRCKQRHSLRACLYNENFIKALKVPISGSFYSVHLQEWLKVFPRKQIFILRTEDFSKDVTGSLLKLFFFLRLDSISTKQLYRIGRMPHYYVTKGKRSAGEILPTTRELLDKVFAPFNQELADMLNDNRYLWHDSLTEPVLP